MAALAGVVKIRRRACELRAFRKSKTPFPLLPNCKIQAFTQNLAGLATKKSLALVMLLSKSNRKDAQKAVYEDIASHTAALLSLIARQLHAADTEKKHSSATAAPQFQEAQGNEA